MQPSRPTPFQSDISDAHVRRLERAMTYPPFRSVDMSSAQFSS